jgi:predicted DsbA family dithiol-disulfide isomerase
LLTIDVVSDVVCPWCFVGKKRLEAALRLRPDVQALVRFHPFFLDPTVPREGKPRIDYITGKFGGTEKITDGHRRLTELGKSVGIDFHFEKIERQPNTLDAHRIIHWAQEEGQAGPVKEKLMSMFFIEGADLTNLDVLASAAKAGGLDPAAIRKDLQSGKDEDLVRKQAQAASASGVGGVPFFVFGNKYALSGAHEPENIASAIDQAMGGEPTNAA